MKKGPYHFLLIYPLQTAPSQRFRFEQFFPLLRKHGISYTTNSFYDDKTFSILYKKNNRFVLALRLLSCFLRRCRHMFFLRRYQYIFIQRGAAPFGPPLFEWIIRFIYRKPIIYDFDDAIWMSPQANESKLSKWVKAYYKVKKICSWSHLVIAGNQHLSDYAKQFCKHVFIIPTVVDTEKFMPDDTVIKMPVTIGWTGSHTTLPYLQSLEPVLSRLQKKYNISLKVIANKPPSFKDVNFEFVEWSEENEVNELRKIDIGIMPLPLDEWTKGKCGFKAIQYMALEKAAVVSAVGVNNEIIDHGKNGFVCSNDGDWEKELSYLIEHSEKLPEIGKRARDRITKDFSLEKAEALWCEVLKTH